MPKKIKIKTFRLIPSFTLVVQLDIRESMGAQKHWECYSNIGTAPNKPEKYQADLLKLLLHREA